MGFQGVVIVLLAASMIGSPVAAGEEVETAGDSSARPGETPVTDSRGHLEVPDDPPAGEVKAHPRPGAETVSGFVRGTFVSVQVNVAPGGTNIPGDAANEPSIAVDPTAPNRMAVGWRQFDTIASNFRQAGWGYSRDGGRSWTFPGVLTRGTFRSDPVLEMTAEGRMLYYSLQGDLRCDVFASDDGGRTWSGPTSAFGGDKPWTVVDRSGGMGHGHYYVTWSTESNPWGTRIFTRSADGGQTFMDPLTLTPAPIWGTLAVGPEGELYLGGNASFDFNIFVVLRSLDARDGEATPTFDIFSVDLGGAQVAAANANPVGLLGQVWVAADTSDGPGRGNVYMLASVDPPGPDPMDVHFTRSEDLGETWSPPIAVHTDSRGAWQWFGTMAVAPTGRIDVVWVESLDAGQANVGELYYASSDDAGYSWSAAVPITPVFDSHLGWPQQSKLGDYYHMVSDRAGADLAYAATFNGEQDVYYLRIGDRDCNVNGIGDGEEIAAGTTRDCDADGIPDSCQVAAGAALDSDGDGELDACEQPPRLPGGRVGFLHDKDADQR